MNEQIEKIRAQILERYAQTTARERWLLVLVVGVVTVFLVQAVLVSPLQASARASEQRVEELGGQIQRAQRIAQEIQLLNGQIATVEQRIQSGAKTNLFSLLEEFAQQAEMKDRLESIKPKPPGGNARYPETRVEVSLRGATLAQTVSFLYRIETAPLYLIVRSIRMKSRGDKSNLLDVTFSVSSFERS
jgi:Tfp pilus assembly protein PilO